MRAQRRLRRPGCRPDRAAAPGGSLADPFPRPCRRRRRSAWRRPGRSRGRQGRSPCKPAHRGLAELGHERGILREALVGAAPAVVPRHGDARREGPLDAGGADLARGDARRSARPARGRACSRGRCCAGRPSRRARCCGRARRRCRRAAECAGGCASARFWSRSYMSVQSLSVLLAPDRSRRRSAPSRERASRRRRPSASRRSAWVIWPTFSSSVMRSTIARAFASCTANRFPASGLVAGGWLAASSAPPPSDSAVSLTIVIFFFFNACLASENEGWIVPRSGRRCPEGEGSPQP